VPSLEESTATAATASLLSPLPVPNDNPAMEEELQKIEPPKSNRRWLQFSLRTLMIVVTLLAAQCGFVAWVIQERHRLIVEREDAIRQRDRWQFLATMVNKDLDVLIDNVTGKLEAATDQLISGQRRLSSGSRLPADERAKVQGDIFVYMRETDTYRWLLALLVEKKKMLEVRSPLK
jgi:hypothetical protein